MTFDLQQPLSPLSEQTTSENRKRRHRVSNRDRKRKIAAESALVQSFRQIGLLQATNLSNIEVKKKHPLVMALGPSNYDDPSDYLLALPIAQTPDLWDCSEVEEPETADSITYAVLEDGQYRFDLESVAYELTDELFEEEAAHYKWIKEVDRSVTTDIEEYVHLNPKFHLMTVRQRERKIFELSLQPDDEFIKQWHETCKDIPFDAIDEETLEAQLIMSIARAAYLNPLPSDVPEDEIEEFVEKVQRTGIEYHRAHNRKFLCLWKEKVKKMRKLEKCRKERQERELQAFLHTPQKEQERAEWQLPSPPRDENTPTFGIGSLNTITPEISVLSTTSPNRGMSLVGNSPPEPAFGMGPLLLASGAGPVPPSQFQTSNEISSHSWMPWN